jgi:DNA polymerase III subunit gamma/tau
VVPVPVAPLAPVPPVVPAAPLVPPMLPAPDESVPVPVDVPEVLPVDDEPDAPVPLVPVPPEVPPVSVLREASPVPDAELPPLPEAPLVMPPALPLLDGVVAEEPLDVLGSLLEPDDGKVVDGEVALLPLPVPAPDACANAIDDTDAIMTNESDRSVVVSLMGYSLS